MIIDLTITVQTEEDKWSVKPIAATWVHFERQYNVKVPQLGNSLSMEHLVWLAWEQSRRENRPVKPFNEFLDTVIDLELGEPDTTPLPKKA